MAQQLLHNGGDQVGTVHGDVKEVCGGGAQIGQTQIDHQQADARHQAGAADHADLRLGLGVSLGLGTFENDEAKQKGGQNVHGLVAGLDAGGGHVLHQGLVPHRADGGDHTHHNEDQQADEQGGGEDFAHDVHHRPLPHAKQQDQQEEEHREEDGAHTGDQGSHRGLKGGGGGPGNGQHGTDAQHDGAHQQHGRDLPNAGGDLFRAALPENSEHRQQSQADVRDVVADEAQQPMGAGLQPQKTWKTEQSQ